MSPGRLKLAFVTPFAERLGGSDNTLLNYLRHTDRARFDHLVVFRGAGPFEREVAGLGIRTAVLPEGRLRQLQRTGAAIRRLAAILREERPDLIVNWLSTGQLYGAPAALLAGMAGRTMWWQRDLHTGSRLSRGRTLDQLATLLPARAIGANSLEAAQAQGRVWPHRPTFSLLPGIEAPPPAPPDRLTELRRSLEIPEGRAVVGISGRLVRWKGQHRLLRALAALHGEGRDLHGLLVGGAIHTQEPAFEAELRRLARELSLGGRVTLTGHVPDPGPYVQLMDVFVNASDPEPFGLVLLEAMALGVPVIAVDAGGPREILEQGRSGLLSPTSSPSDLAREIRRLLDEPELRARIAAAGKARYEKRFTAERMAREMDERLARLCRPA